MSKAESIDRHTRISVRQLLVLVAYLAIVMYLIVPKAGQGRFFSGLTWVYHLSSNLQTEVLLWPHVVGGILMLLGTVTPFLLMRWWTIVTALFCGSVYALIGYQAAAHNFLF